MDIYERAVAHFGKEAQTDKIIEECAELITAVIHDRLGRTDTSTVEEELADLEIMISQARLFRDSAAIDAWKAFKLARLEARIEGAS